MASWLYGKLTLWQVDFLESWLFSKLTWWQVDVLASWLDGKLTFWKLTISPRIKRHPCCQLPTKSYNYFHLFWNCNRRFSERKSWPLSERFHRFRRTGGDGHDGERRRFNAGLSGWVESGHFIFRCLHSTTFSSSLTPLRNVPKSLLLTSFFKQPSICE